jgi:hypothetical protein
MTSLLLALMALSSSAFAQDACPVGANSGERIPRSSRVRVLGIHPEDAYSDNPSAVVGRVGVTTEPWTSDSCWYTGSFREANGEERYFFKVAVADASRTATTTGVIPCPPESYASSAPLRDGTRVKLVSVHREDPRYPEWVRLIGLTGTISNHTPRGGCWMSGVLTTDDGVAVDLARGALWQNNDAYMASSTGGMRGRDSRTTTPVVADLSMDAPVAFDGPRIPRGQRLRILSIDREDAYYAEREDIVGLRCTATEVLRRAQPSLFTGEVRCDDRRKRYFLKVSVQLLPY